MYESADGKSYSRDQIYSANQIKEIFKDIQDEVDILESYKCIYMQSYRDWNDERKKLQPKFKSCLSAYKVKK